MAKVPIIARFVVDPPAMAALASEPTLSTEEEFARTWHWRWWQVERRLMRLPAGLGWRVEVNPGWCVWLVVPLGEFDFPPVSNVGGRLGLFTDAEWPAIEAFWRARHAEALDRIGEVAARFAGWTVPVITLRRADGESGSLVLGTSEHSEQAALTLAAA